MTNLFIAEQILGALAETSYNTSFPAGCLLAKFGSRATMTSAMSITSLGYLLPWINVAWCKAIDTHFILLYFTFIPIGYLCISFLFLPLFETWIYITTKYILVLRVAS